MIITYPRGHLYCEHCCAWKDVNEFNPAWAVRNGEHSGELIYPSLICEDCSNLEKFQEHNMRLAPLENSQYSFLYRDELRKAWERYIVKHWKAFAKAKKERRDFIVKLALVLKRCNASMVDNQHILHHIINHI